VAADFNCREAFARTAREFVDRFSLDGIDRKLPCCIPLPVYIREVRK
jgi:hypothetical protein